MIDKILRVEEEVKDFLNELKGKDEVNKHFYRIILESVTEKYKRLVEENTLLENQNFKDHILDFFSDTAISIHKDLWIEFSPQNEEENKFFKILGDFEVVIFLGKTYSGGLLLSVADYSLYENNFSLSKDGDGNQAYLSISNEFLTKLYISLNESISLVDFSIYPVGVGGTKLFTQKYNRHNDLLTVYTYTRQYLEEHEVLQATVDFYSVLDNLKKLRRYYEL